MTFLSSHAKSEMELYPSVQDVKRGTCMPPNKFFATKIYMSLNTQPTYYFRTAALVVTQEHGVVE
jgi:hypothetical protein